MREWKQQLLQKSPRTGRKEGVSAAKSWDPALMAESAALVGGLGGKLVTGGGGGAFRIGGTSSDESDPLLLAGQPQHSRKHRHRSSKRWVIYFTSIQQNH